MMTETSWTEDLPNPKKAQMEREANAFALALLMPASLLIDEIEKYPALNEDVIKKLAKTFQVNQGHVYARLIGLGVTI